jgi:hypothetical protein
MVQTIILSIVLVLGAMLYIALTRRVSELESQVELHRDVLSKHVDVMKQLMSQLDKLTNAHNEVAEYLNNNNRTVADEFEFDSYTVFKAPKGEA